VDCWGRRVAILSTVAKLLQVAALFVSKQVGGFCDFYAHDNPDRLNEVIQRVIEDIAST
jgi:hypothetical protein